MTKPIFRLLLLATALTFVTAPPTAMANQTESSSVNCYPADTAYVTGAMNIRQNPSTTSRVVAMATSGSSYLIAASIRGDKWCWLNIGQGWLAHTARVQSTKPQYPAATRSTASVRSTTTQITTANIDNCCFIDRQCNSDYEWTQGYWAFQNNQCSAPVSATTVVSTTYPDSEKVDNCCFLGWHCTTEHEWTQGFQNYLVGQCEHRGVTIEGSEQFKSTMDTALKLLRNRAPHWYTYTLDGLNKIREVEGSRMRVSSYSGDNRWGRDFGKLVRRDIVAIAASLAHEACHVHRRRAGQFPTGQLPGETACTQIEIHALEAIGAAPWVIQREKNLLANLHRPECQWWHNSEHSRIAANCYEQA